MKRLMLLCLCASLVVGFISAPGHSQKPDELSSFMRAKLTHSQKVVEGLATEDYEMIAKSAQEMSLLSQAASWQVLQTPEYAQHSREFRRATDSLTEMGKQKNLDGAALAYLDVTLKCVNCHKYVRRVRTASLQESSLFVR